MDKFTPRYFAIEQALRTRIAGLHADDPLPSDAELCEEFGVSRMTARAAVQRLVQDGLVYRQTGRGTYVAPRVVDRQLSNLRGFSAEMRARGLTPSSTVLYTRFQPGNSDQTAALRLAEGSQIVVIERVRMADGIPMAYERAALTARCAGVLDADLSSGSLHSALVGQGVVPNSGESSVTAELASAEDAEHLHVKRRSPLLVERRLIRDAATVPIEWTESRYVPDRYNLTVQFTVDLPTPPSSHR
ncbi:GntR family transcriptional regulator [Kutzneria sp. CA-103260]|uniref:GntR family transcriptional regulator n=1 Tax=Kutzneria sp. CA-103260 TaxID=2802641 RepID=UPI001BAAA422|nr:GntR family transcriptional regulator [Kutzneria sp. CA-103260]QUQ72385.1 GntR family transcriptional regulator [Kutzneria sp. CA-103260]